MLHAWCALDGVTDHQPNIGPFNVSARLGQTAYHLEAHNMQQVRCMSHIHAHDMHTPYDMHVPYGSSQHVTGALHVPYDMHMTCMSHMTTCTSLCSMLLSDTAGHGFKPQW